MSRRDNKVEHCRFANPQDNENVQRTEQRMRWNRMVLPLCWFVCSRIRVASYDIRESFFDWTVKSACSVKI